MLEKMSVFNKRKKVDFKEKEIPMIISLAKHFLSLFLDIPRDEVAKLVFLPPTLFHMCQVMVFYGGLPVL